MKTKTKLYIVNELKFLGGILGTKIISILCFIILSYYYSNNT